MENMQELARYQGRVGRREWECCDSVMDGKTSVMDGETHCSYRCEGGGVYQHASQSL